MSIIVMQLFDLSDMYLFLFIGVMGIQYKPLRDQNVVEMAYKFRFQDDFMEEFMHGLDVDYNSNKYICWYWRLVNVKNEAGETYDTSREGSMRIIAKEDGKRIHVSFGWDDIYEWSKEDGLKHLQMWYYIKSTNFDHGDVKYKLIAKSE